MKLRLIHDKKADEYEIESKYLWNLPQCQESKVIDRINLSESNKTDFTWISDKPVLVEYAIALPNNKIFGIMIDKHLSLQYLFIADEFFKIKILKAPVKLSEASQFHTSCFYDDSIFIFEGNKDANQRGSAANRARRYFIKHDFLIEFSTPPFDYPPHSCIGIKQKIVIATELSGIWMLDINLESYSRLYPIQEFWDFLADQKLIKLRGMGYLLRNFHVTTMYCCGWPLYDWPFVFGFKDKLLFNALSNYSRYKDSIYFVSNEKLYEFPLEEYKSQAVKSLV